MNQVHMGAAISVDHSIEPPDSPGCSEKFTESVKRQAYFRGALTTGAMDESEGLERQKSSRGLEINPTEEQVMPWTTLEFAIIGQMSRKTPAQLLAEARQ